MPLIMETTKTFKRYLQTRRFTGRRGLTPIKTRQKRLIPKTHRSSARANCFLNRRHTVEDVSVPKQSAAQHHNKRKGSDTNQHREHQEWKRDQGGQDNPKRENPKEQTSLEQIRDEENPVQSVHPGTLQEMSPLSYTETPLIEIDAFQETSENIAIEAEELQ